MNRFLKCTLLVFGSAFLLACGNDTSAKTDDNTSETNLPQSSNAGMSGGGNETPYYEAPKIVCDSSKKEYACNYGSVCRDGFCDSCKSDDECFNDEYVCVYGYCMREDLLECKNDEDCKGHSPYEYPNCVPAQVTESDGPVIGNFIMKTTCTRPSESSRPACETRAECRGGVVCLGGYCSGCENSNQCLSNETCINSRCIQNELIGCRLNSDCTELGEKASCLVTWNNLTLDEIMKSMLAGTWDMDKDPFDANPATACRAYPEP